MPGSKSLLQQGLPVLKWRCRLTQVVLYNGSKTMVVVVVVVVVIIIIRGAKIIFITARSELRKVLFLASSVCVFWFVYEICRELLNGFAPN